MFTVDVKQQCNAMQSSSKTCGKKYEEYSKFTHDVTSTFIRSCYDIHVVRILEKVADTNLDSRNRDCLASFLFVLLYFSFRCLKHMDILCI